MDIGPTLGGFTQGLGHALSGHIYNPHLTPEEQGAANTGTWLGDLGADVGVGLGGAATGAVAGGTLGSVIPGVGTAVGAAVGAPVGAFLAVGGKHLLSNTQDQVHEYPNKPINWGTAASDALINGAMGAIAPGEGSLLKKVFLDSAIGGVGGAWTRSRRPVFQQ